MKRAAMVAAIAAGLLAAACGQTPEECFEDKAAEYCGGLTDMEALDMCLAHVYDTCNQEDY